MSLRRRKRVPLNSTDARRASYQLSLTSPVDVYEMSTQNSQTLLHLIRPADAHRTSIVVLLLTWMLEKILWMEIMFLFTLGLGPKMIKKIQTSWNNPMILTLTLMCYGKLSVCLSRLYLLRRRQLNFLL